jgi:hypothetical protein
MINEYDLRSISRAEETVTYQHFKLTVMQGEFTDSQIVVIAWGEGNREFIKMLVHLSRHHLPSIFTFSLASHQEFWNNTKKCKYITDGNCVLMFGIIYHDDPCQDFNNYRLLEIYYVSLPLLQITAEFHIPV